ncbi:hypothetical protein MOC62_07735 [Bacillus spizizenii]|nr:hypothetical protein [Bacillus spizizenii]
MTEEVKRLRCAVADLIGENERLKAALNTIATRKKSAYVSTQDMAEDFIKIAREALK